MATGLSRWLVLRFGVDLSAILPGLAPRFGDRRIPIPWVQLVGCLGLLCLAIRALPAGPGHTLRSMATRWRQHGHYTDAAMNDPCDERIQALETVLYHLIDETAPFLRADSLKVWRGRLDDSGSTISVMPTGRVLVNC